MLAIHLIYSEGKISPFRKVRTQGDDQALLVYRKGQEKNRAESLAPGSLLRSEGRRFTIIT